MLNGTHKKKLRKLLEDLVNIRSDKKNTAMAAFLKKALGENGWKNIKDSGGNVWGRIGSGKIKLLYDIHSDTITARNTGWNTDPFRAEFKDGHLYGRGAVDDKGPLAAAIFSGNFLKNLAGCCVYLLASDREEIDEGYGCRTFLRQEKIKPDFVIISEPSDLRLIFGQRGRVEITLTAPGVPAHGSMPEKGKNAILLMNTALASLAKLRFKKIHPFTATTVTPTVIKSEGEGNNVLPLSCSVLLDIRLNHKESVASLIKILKKNIPREIDIKAKNFCPAWLLKNKSFSLAARKTFAEAYGKAPTPAYWKFCTNGSEYASNGIPVIGFGPGKPELCHKKNENIKLADVEQAVDFFKVLPRQITGFVKC
ncbi:M20/M25/M40 family metallo-hydrolase [bacterium]|nr:M20/M25/M40 family metallo-hydrolase [bacterium]MBU3955615.1 M20/M25/M40 family metallo-hydrolase [bacterium]MBU4134209.1 M20/M25/M40 family metallo-hydrolase [bacterium]